MVNKNNPELNPKQQWDVKYSCVVFYELEYGVPGGIRTHDL